MNIVLFGAPGSGKGTQSELLVQKLGYLQISTGDLFRSAIKNQTDLGRRAKQFIDKGELVPDSITVGLVEEVLKKSNGKKFILDGFPRNTSQADALARILETLNMKIDRAIFLDVPTDALLSRLTGRRVCKSCGTVFHVMSKPPRSTGVCDNCGGVVLQRNDDREEVIATRLKTYEDATEPLRSLYKEQGKLVVINGNQNADTVFTAISLALSEQ